MNEKLILIFILFLLVPFAYAISESDLEPYRYLHNSFETNLTHDDSDNNNEGSIVGDPVLETSGCQVGTNCGTFDGTDDLIIYEGDTGIYDNMKASANFTITIWINTGATGAIDSIVARNPTTEGDEWYVAFDDRGGEDNLHISTVGGGKASFANAPVITDTWNFIVAKTNYTGANKDIKIYLNGTLMATDTDEFASGSTNGQDIYLAGIESIATWDFIGKIDEFAIWNYSMPDAHISFLYDLGVAGTTFTGVTPDVTPPVIDCSFNVSLDSFYINTVVNFSCIATDDTELVSLNMTWNYTAGTVHSDYTVTTPAAVYNITTISDSEGDVINFTGFVTDTSDNVAQNSTIITIQTQPATVVTITNPSNDETLDNKTYPLWINGTVTVASGVVNSTWINNTNWKMDSGTITAFGFYLNGTITEFENNFIMIFANNSNGVVSNDTVYFDTDFTNPIVKSSLSTNNTFYYSQLNLTFEFNFTDTRQVYSFNITTPEGYLYNITGLNVTKFVYNGSINISSYAVGLHNITTEVCDAHTKKKIKDWETQINNIESEIRFNFGEQYFLIRPLDNTELEGASTEKLEDRYAFTFKKNKGNKKNSISFVVLSSEKIDIIGNTNKYSGWLVIPKLQKWIDFNTKDRDKIKYEIIRLNDRSVMIRVKGIKDDIFTFNSAGDLNCIKETYKYYVFNHSVVYDSTVISNSPTYLKLVIDLPDLKVNTTGFLTYNNTSYTGSNVSSPTQINYTINITPQQYENITTNITFYWNYTLNNKKYNTSSYIQVVNSIFLTRWDNLSNASAINYTLYDEETNTIIEGDILGNFYYLEGYASFDEPASTNFSLAIFPAGASTSGNYTVLYSASGYTERRYSETTAVYNNNTQIIKLYLLNTSLGGYATFRVLDIYQSALINVKGRMEKVIGGSYVTVEQQTSDGSGLMTFFVNPDNDYRFTFSKIGYISYSTIIRPVTTEIYTVTLEAEGTVIEPSYSTEIIYSFSPINTVLNNGTNYNFTFNLTSGYYDIDSCTLYLKNDSDTLTSSSDSYTSRNCFITIEFNTGNQSNILSEAEYTLDGVTYPFTLSTQYTVKYTYKGEFSLMNLIDDIRAFSGAGFNDFTRMIIAFIIIFAIVGYASSQLTGLREPETLIVLTWALVLIFSYLGFLTLNFPLPKIAGLPATWLNQYIIFILITLGASSYLIRRHL